MEPEKRDTRTLKAPVQPLAVIAISVFIPAFIAMKFCAQQYPDHWFVRKFLAGERSWVAGLVLFGLMTFIVNVIDRSMKRRRTNSGSASSSQR
jgi:hypothetical protein